MFRWRAASPSPAGREWGSSAGRRVISRQGARLEVLGLLNKLSERNQATVAAQLAELPVQTAEAG